MITTSAVYAMILSNRILRIVYLREVLLRDKPTRTKNDDDLSHNRG